MIQLMRVRRQTYRRGREWWGADHAGGSHGIPPLSVRITENTVQVWNPTRCGENIPRRPGRSARVRINFPLPFGQGKGILPVRCGRSPLCRCLNHLRRRREVAASLCCRYFVFCKLIIPCKSHTGNVLWYKILKKLFRRA